jgi:hypothetical protein
MIQRKPYTDERLDALCAYCGSAPDTRDHVPPRIFLDKPYPENLMQVGACEACNNERSRDEEYAACLIECLISGTTDLDENTREKIRQILDRKPALRAEIKRDIESPEGSAGHQAWSDRMWKVLVKIARGHARYENSQQEHDAPSRRIVKFLSAMSHAEREVFLQPLEIDLWPEVGSRAMIAIVEGDTQVSSYWTTVQDGNYAYSASFGIERAVRIILRDQLAVEVTWEG